MTHVIQTKKEKKPLVFCIARQTEALLLTAVTLLITKMNANEVFHPEGIADTALGVGFARPVVGAVTLTNCNNIIIIFHSELMSKYADHGTKMITPDGAGTE